MRNPTIHLTLLCLMLVGCESKQNVEKQPIAITDTNGVATMSFVDEPCKSDTIYFNPIINHSEIKP